MPNTANTMFINPTSRDSAFAEPIVLRENGSFRIVFLPQIVNNSNDLDASVRGCFVTQRALKGGGWEDYSELSPSKLKAGEWMKLDLKSAEILLFFEGLSKLYAFHTQHHIPKRAGRYMPVEEGFEALLSVNPDDLAAFLKIRKGLGIELLSRLIQWLSSLPEPEPVITALESANPQALQSLNMIVGLSNLKSVMAIWEAQKTNSSEEFWQRTLKEYSFVLSQVFAQPIVVLDGKAYVGGKSIDNTGGNVVDFLCASHFTRNAVLIEIKTPTAPLVAGLYRTGIYRPAQDLAGAVTQVQDYRLSIQQNFDALAMAQARNEGEPFDVFDPLCVVIVGNCSSLTNNDQRKSFELYRNGLKDVRVLTFDELFEKVKTFIDLMEGKVELHAAPVNIMSVEDISL